MKIFRSAAWLSSITCHSKEYRNHPKTVRGCRNEFGMTQLKKELEQSGIEIKELRNVNEKLGNAIKN